MTSSSSDDGDDSSSEEEEKKEKKEKKEEKEDDSDDSSDDSDDSSSSKKKKKKKKVKDKKSKKKGKKDKKDKKKKEKKGPKKKKEKKKKKKKVKAGGESMRGSVSNQFGKYGIIKTEDFFSKKTEFLIWAAEVRKVNTDALGQMQQKDLFKEYVEDYNTATMPSKKYYNVTVFEQESANKRRKQKSGDEVDKFQRSSMVSFDDEKARRDEVMAMKAKKAESLVSQELQSLRNNKEKAADMQNQARLNAQRDMLQKVGHGDAAAKISDRLNPNKVNFLERRLAKKDGPAGFAPEG